MGFSLNEREFKTLRKVEENSGYDELNLYDLASLIQRTRKQAPKETRALAERLLRRTFQDKSLEARVRGLLEPSQ